MQRRSSAENRIRRAPYRERSWEQLILALYRSGRQADALAAHTKLSAREIAEQSMKIAAKMCIYTNDNFTIEEL